MYIKRFIILLGLIQLELYGGCISIFLKDNDGLIIDAFCVLSAKGGH